MGEQRPGPDLSAPIDFEWSGREFTPGLWLADVRITATRLELMSVSVRAPDEATCEELLGRLVRHIVEVLAHPSHFRLN